VSYEQEFRTVDIICESQAEARGVDAFSLSVIKAERQIRKLFTYLIFTFPSFTQGDINALRDTLTATRQVYLAGFERGFDQLYPRTLHKEPGNGIGQSPCPDWAEQSRQIRCDYGTSRDVEQFFLK
jgi:hypothetical protein